MSLYAAGGSYADGVIEQDLFYEENGFQYFAATFPPDGYDTVRDGVHRPVPHREQTPSAWSGAALSGSTELGGNHCACAAQKRVTLAPGRGHARLLFLLGEGPRAEAA